MEIFDTATGDYLDGFDVADEALSWSVLGEMAFLPDHLTISVERGAAGNVTLEPSYDVSHLAFSPYRRSTATVNVHASMLQPPARG